MEYSRFGRNRTAISSTSQRDGLVRHEIGTRKKGDYNSPVKVILWSLAEQEQPDEQ